MGDGVFNIAKGRVVEYYNRVENNDPAASRLGIMLGFGTITDAILKDLDDFALIKADVNFTEALFTAYVRKFLSDTELDPLPAPDDAGDRYDVDIPDQTWSPAGNGVNDTLTRLIIGYDPLGTDVDANYIPLCFFDFAVTTDGSDLTAKVNAAGFFRAS